VLHPIPLRALFQVWQEAAPAWCAGWCEVCTACQYCTAWTGAMCLGYKPLMERSAATPCCCAPAPSTWCGVGAHGSRDGLCRPGHLAWPLPTALGFLRRGGAALAMPCAASLPSSKN